MLTLRLLGGLVLDNPDRVPLGRAAQRRRLALLAVLATPSGTAVPREKLLGLLWPEVPPDDARHRLSVALYDLRLVLGPDALVLTPHSAMLTSGALETDVALFQGALDCGDVAAAIAHYTGPFLDGIYLVDAPNFEHWVDAQRQTLESAYGRALEQVARQHERAARYGAAADHWRKLLELEPYSALATLGLMRALDSAGDRAGAVLQGRAHVERFRNELDAEPDSEVERLLQEIKQRLSANGDARLPSNGIHSPSIVPEAIGAVDADSAAPTPNPEKRGRRTWPVFASLTALVAVVFLAGALELWSRDRGGRNTRGSGTSSSTAAAAFNAAKEHMRAGRFDDAVDGFSRAIQEDSTYTLAHFRLAIATLWADQPGSMLDAHVQRALRRIEDLDPIDADLLNAFIQWREGSADIAEALTRRVLASDSTSVEAWHLLGETLFHYNPIRGRLVNEATASFEHAAKLDPGHFGALWHLTQLAALEGRTEDVRALSDRLLALQPDRIRTLEINVFRAAVLGNDAEFARLVEGLAPADPSLLFGFGWRLAVFARRPAHAEKVFELLTAVDRQPQIRAFAQRQLIYLDVARGQPTKAMQRVRELDESLKSDVVDLATQLLPAIVLAQAGQPDQLHALRAANSAQLERLRARKELTVEAGSTAAFAWADGVLFDTAALRVRANRLALMKPEISGDSTAQNTLDAYLTEVRVRYALATGDVASTLQSVREMQTKKWFGDASLGLSQAQTVARLLRGQVLLANNRTNDAEPWLAGLASHTIADLALYVPASLLRIRGAIQKGDLELLHQLCREAGILWENAEPVLRSHLASTCVAHQ